MWPFRIFKMATKDNFCAIWDRNCRPLAAFDRCMLNTGAFALENSRGCENGHLIEGHA